MNIINDYELLTRSNSLRQAHRWGDEELLEELKNNKKLIIVYFCNEKAKRVQFAIIEENFNPANIDYWNNL